MRDINILREEIDKIDSNIIELLSKRNQLAPEIAMYKKANGLEIFQEEREKEVLAKKAEMSKNKGLNDNFVQEIFKAIMNESKRVQYETLKEQN